jgi:hypothetical protein
MELTRYDFEHPINLYNLGDVHRGDQCHDNKIFKHVINLILEDPHARWVSTGDLCNVALKTSVSSVYKSKNLQEELDILTQKELKPIADKCLGFVSSNHHRRFEKEAGLSLDIIISRELGIPYLGAIGLLAIACGRSVYYVAMHHGVGGGKKRGSKANNLFEFSSIIPCADIYLEGHTHSPDYFPETFHYIDRKRGSIRQYTAHFCVTGHYITWDESYAQDIKLNPKPKGSSVLTLAYNNSGKQCNKKVEYGFAGE